MRRERRRPEHSETIHSRMSTHVPKRLIHHGGRDSRRKVGRGCFACQPSWAPGCHKVIGELGGAKDEFGVERSLCSGWLVQQEPESNDLNGQKSHPLMYASTSMGRTPVRPDRFHPRFETRGFHRGLPVVLRDPVLIESSDVGLPKRLGLFRAAQRPYTPGAGVHAEDRVVGPEIAAGGEYPRSHGSLDRLKGWVIRGHVLKRRRGRRLPCKRPKPGA